MNDHLQTAADKWKEAPSWTRGLLVGTVVCAMISLIVWRLLPGPSGGDMTALFSDLALEDAAAIRDYLEERRIPHRVTAGGAAIEVPPDRVHSLRLDLASMGVPSRGAVGFEIMDSMPWGATDFERHVSYIRGLQGELERTIEGFEEVRKARVHVVLPRESVFISRNTPATAAVFLELRPMAQLGTDAIQGIIHLVASSVENLDPEKVTVVDTQGVILSHRAAAPDNDAAAVRDGIHMQLQFEESLRGRLQAMLEQVLGPGNVALQVSAQMNFDDREIHTELFEPASEDGGLITSLHQMEESFSGNQAFPETGAGADSNLPTYQASGTEGASTYERTETTQNVAVNRTTEHWKVAPGAVERLSVAVVVNGALTPDQEQVLGGVVAAALGSDPGRNDSVVVTGLPFDTSLVDQLQEHAAAPAPDAPREQVADYPLPYVVGAGVALLLVLILVVVALRRRRGNDAEFFEELEAPKPADVVRSKREDAEAMRQREALLDTLGGNGSGLRSTAKEMAEENPAKVAQLLRAWLADELDS